MVFVHSHLPEGLRTIGLYGCDSLPFQRVLGVGIHGNHEAGRPSSRYDCIDKFLSDETLAVIGDDQSIEFSGTFQ